MTRFVGDAVGVRSGKKRGTTMKDIKKEMEQFKETGVHPELEEARQRAAAAAMQLPEPSTARPYIFFDVEVNKNPIGRIVVELFDDVAPVAVAHFRNRCSEGASDSFKGTLWHKIVADQAIFGGKSSKYRGGMHMKRYPQLKHTQRGAVSLSLAGDEFLIALTRCLHRDETHQVVGRVSSGDEVLDRINSLSTNSDDAPFQRALIARSGFTNAAGTFEDFDEGGAGRSKKETAAEAAARLKREASEARAAVKEALQTGLSQKRKAEGPAGRGGGGAKRGMLDVLGEISSDEDSEEEGSSDEGGSRGQQQQQQQQEEWSGDEEEEGQEQQQQEQEQQPEGAE